MNQQRKLLIVDSDDAILKLLDDALSTSGYEVRTTTDVQQALLMMRYYEPDAVLLAQEEDEAERNISPRVAPLPSEENFSFATLCRLWRIPIIYMLDAPDSPYKRTWDDSFFR